MASPPPSPGAASVAPSIASASGSRASGLSARISSTLSSYLFESAISIQTSPARLPTDKRKTPLSLPQTAGNFRQFVQKSGPLFYFQDAVEATLLWDDWSWTLMWMGIWAVVALYPYLLLCVPSFVICIIMMKTHQARFHLSHATNHRSPSADEQDQPPTPAEAVRHTVLHPNAIGDGVVRPPLVPAPAPEGSVRYLENLRDIQNMMKLVPDGYDAIVPVVPYLNWSSYNRTLLIFQLSIVVTLVMFFLGPLLPLRLILLIAGEGAFIATHPWIHPVVEAIGKLRASSGGGKKGEQLQSVVRKRGREASHRLRTWLELDRLDDTVWEKGWRDVEMFENERFAGRGTTAASQALSASWSSANLRQNDRKPWTRGSDGWSPDVGNYSLDLRQVASSLEKGWKWVEDDDWRIDWVGDWSAVGVDDEGYVYTDADWQRPAPYAYGHAEQPEYPVLAPELAAGADGELPSSSASNAGWPDEKPRETDGRAFPAAAITNVKAQTRRRRWLRRCVRV